MGDPNKPKSVISISNCISSLYEWMKILVFVIVICFKCVYAQVICFPLSVKLSTGF